MAFPPIPLQWASDTNYAAGTDPWSGTATKVTPSTQSKTKGFIPEGTASGQQLNYLLNAFASAANAMVNSVMGAWMGVQTFPATIQDTGASSCYYVVTPWFNKSTRAWYRPVTNGSTPEIYRSRNYTDWISVASGFSSSNFCLGAANNNSASANYGDMLVGSISLVTTLKKYTQSTGLWSTVSLPNAYAPIQIKHDAFNSKWIVLSQNSTNVACHTAPDTTYTFTLRTLSGSPTLTGGSGRDPYLVISHTGVALFQATATILNRSTDGGTTWTTVTPTSAPKTEHDIAWIPDRLEWVLIGADNKVYYSLDGITWTVRATGTPFSDVGGFISSLASVGSTLFCTWTKTSGNGGLGFSMDGGATWSFSGPATTLATAGTSGARGKLTAGDDALMCTHIAGSTSVSNGYTFLRGLDWIASATVGA